MAFIQPTPPPYDALEWVQKPLPERARMVCRAWALQGYGSPTAVYLVYALKIALYVVAWCFFCSLSPELGGPGEIERWWLKPTAFQKAILWSMLFEGLGFGCGSGPLTGRYLPPVGGFLYFARPGTTKLPVRGGLSLLGGTRRSLLDVALYLVLIGALLWALSAPHIDAQLLWLIAAVLPLAALRDRTLFLAFRGEHYWTTLMCFVLAHDWIAGAKCVQLALWFWAGVSKLNHHFPAVVCVMTSNSPIARWQWLRRRFYRDFPDDLRPSRLAEVMAHAGTALELGIPLVLVFSAFFGGDFTLQLGMAMMLLLHTFITSSVPMGVPLEWNVMVVYGGCALFWAHPEIQPFALDSAPLALLLLLMLIALPSLGNLAPRYLSFLLSMRYYAGNWAASVWLFRGESHKKLERLTTSAGWVYDQLERFYDRTTAVGLVGKVMAFRMMHLHGRSLPRLIPRAVPRLEDYQYLDGEIVAGLVLGWNFGDGHLHQEQLLAAVQAQCGFDEGELRCIFLESQPLGGSSLEYRICDAHSGLMERGELSIAELRAAQPWGAAGT
jgi:hypothetical protein